MSLLGWYSLIGLAVTGAVASWSWLRLQRGDALTWWVQGSIRAFILTSCSYILGLIIIYAVEGHTATAVVTFLLLLGMIWLLRRHVHDVNRYRR